MEIENLLLEFEDIKNFEQLKEKLPSFLNKAFGNYLLVLNISPETGLGLINGILKDYIQIPINWKNENFGFLRIDKNFQNNMLATRFSKVIGLLLYSFFMESKVNLLKAHLKNLQKVNYRLTSDLVNEKNILKEIVKLAANLVDADVAALFLLEKDMLKPVATYNITDTLSYKLGESLVGWVAKTADKVLVKNVEEDSRFFKKSPVEGLKSDISLPLILEDKVIGVLSCGRFKNKPSFNEEDMELLETYALSSAITLRLLQLHNDWKRQLNELKLLFSIASRLGSGDELDSLIPLAVNMVMEALNVNRCSIILIDWINNSPQILRFYGKGANSSNFNIDLSKSEILKYVIYSGLPVLIKSEEDFKKYGFKLKFTYTTPSFISVPIKVDGKVIGVISATEKISGESFTESELKLISTLANQLASQIIQAKLYKEALIDPLTGAYNRKFLEEMFTKWLRRKSKQGIAIYMLDIDYFKKFNDKYGHQMGDKVLKYVVETIKKTLRQNDLVIRYGGEEFLIAVVGTTAQKAQAIAERIRKNIAKNSTSFPEKITVSIGIALFPEEATRTGELIKKADERLYKAKNKGRNCVIFS